MQEEGNLGKGHQVKRIRGGGSRKIGTEGEGGLLLSSGWKADIPQEKCDPSNIITNKKIPALSLNP